MTRLTLFFAALMLWAAPAAAQSFNAEEKAAIDAQIRAYILENPEILMEAMRVLETRQQQQAEQTDRDLVARLGDELVNDGYSHVAGNPDGDVTVVEFADYRCPYCKRAHEAVKALLSADRNVRVVIKEFPILGPDSTFAARAAMAAQIQGEELYATYNDSMMSHQGQLDERSIIRIADEAGLDVEALRRDMDRPEIAENIRRTYSLARQLEINGTPGFVIGDRIVRGFVEYDQLREMVENEREREGG